jgi:hypothetical protein
MPRRPAKVTQGEITRVVRAAKEAGAAEVVIDGEGQIHVVLSLNAPVVSPAPPKFDNSQVWTRPCLQRRNGGHLEMPPLGGIFQKANSGLDPHGYSPACSNE